MTLINYFEKTKLDVQFAEKNLQYLIYKGFASFLGMENSGLEPLTSSLPAKRSPS